MHFHINGDIRKLLVDNIQRRVIKMSWIRSNKKINNTSIICLLEIPRNMKSDKRILMDTSVAEKSDFHDKRV